MVLCAFFILLYSKVIWSKTKTLECTATLALAVMYIMYSRCAHSVWIENHGTNMQKSVSKALL